MSLVHIRYWELLGKLKAEINLQEKENKDKLIWKIYYFFVLLETQQLIWL